MGFTIEDLAIYFAASPAATHPLAKLIDFVYNPYSSLVQVITYYGSTGLYINYLGAG